MKYDILEIENQDREIIGKLVSEFWGDEMILAHREVFFTYALQGIKAVAHGKIHRFLHYQVRQDVCEIMTLASLQESQGIGSALIEAVEQIARGHGCKKIRVTTTNDNLHALGFYQKRGFRWVGMGLEFVDDARKHKPSIPEIGEKGIPIHDEIYLEKQLV